MNIKHEIYRKIFHILLISIPVSYCYLGKWQSLMIFAPITTILFLIDYARQKNNTLNHIFSTLFSIILRDREKTGNNLCGATFVGLAACICFLLFTKEIIVTGFLILAISDTLAALVGKTITSKPFFEKSRAGSMAFFISALLILISCGLFFDVRAWFYIFGLFAVFCVTMFEARPSLIEIDDNFAIPVGFSIIMTFFDIALNYNF